MWIDIASIVFVCVTANHLGLIEAVEGIIRNRLPIISCPKCFTFWSVLIYGLWAVGITDIPLLLAISFLCSYLALWLELLEAFVDTIYMKCYETIYDHTTDTPAADADEDNSAGSVPDMRKWQKKKEIEKKENKN